MTLFDVVLAIIAALLAWFVWKFIAGPFISGFIKGFRETKEQD